MRLIKKTLRFAYSFSLYVVRFIVVGNGFVIFFFSLNKRIRFVRSVSVNRFDSIVDTTVRADGRLGILKNFIR